MRDPDGAVGFNPDVGESEDENASSASNVGHVAKGGAPASAAERWNASEAGEGECEAPTIFDVVEERCCKFVATNAHKRESAFLCETERLNGPLNSFQVLMSGQRSWEGTREARLETTHNSSGESDR